ncbi:hypothetical protein D3C86_1629860 [compost metagenome]
MITAQGMPLRRNPTDSSQETERLPLNSGDWPIRTSKSILRSSSVLNGSQMQQGIRNSWRLPPLRGRYIILKSCFSLQGLRKCCRVFLESRNTTDGVYSAVLIVMAGNCVISRSPLSRMMRFMPVTLQRSCGIGAVNF